jgi:hypothetical protein
LRFSSPLQAAGTPCKTYRKVVLFHHISVYPVQVFVIRLVILLHSKLWRQFCVVRIAFCFISVIFSLLLLLCFLVIRVGTIFGASLGFVLGIDSFLLFPAALCDTSGQGCAEKNSEVPDLLS